MSFKKIDRNKTIVIAIALIFLLGIFITPRLNIVVPGAEGVQLVNDGIQFGYAQPVKSLANFDTLPATYDWGAGSSPSAMTISHSMTFSNGIPEIWFPSDIDQFYAQDKGLVSSELTRATIMDDPFTLPTDKITYYKYVQTGTDSVQITKTILNMVKVDFIIQIYVPTGSGWYNWKDTNLWYMLNTVTWANAYSSAPPTDPNPLTNDTTKFLSSNYRGAFPIMGWIQEYQDWNWKDQSGNTKTFVDDSAESHTQLSPSKVGRQLDLFTSPESKYTYLTSQDILNNPTLVEQALKPNNLPSVGFAEQVFFKISMQNFGAYVQVNSVMPIIGTITSKTAWYPAVYYRIRVVYAVYGDYVYLWTTQKAQSYTSPIWETRTPTEENQTVQSWKWLGDFLNFATSPIGLLTLSGTTIAIFAVVVLVILWWFFPKRIKFDRREGG